MKNFTFLSLAMLMTTFCFAQSFSVQTLDSEPTNTAVFEDLNGDGVKEIVGKSSSNVSQGVYLWHRTSVEPLEFEKIEILPSGDIYYSNLTSGDIDGDGDIDLVVSIGENRIPNLLINNSTSTSFSFEKRPISDVSDAANLTLADLDGLFDLDLVVLGSEFNSTSFLYSEGDGTYTKEIIEDYNNLASKVITADFDEDGDVDVAIASDGRGVDMYENEGTRIFGEKDKIYNDSWASITDMNTADLNGDGKLDIIACSDGTLAEKYFFILMNIGNVGSWLKRNVDGLPKSTALNVLDVNFDGNMDIVLATRDEGAKVMTNINPPSFEYEISDMTGYNTITSLLPGDIDDDGDTDFVAVMPGQFSTFYALNLNPILSIKESEKIAATIFPNPVADQFVIEGDFKNIRNLKIFNVLGQLAYQSTQVEQSGIMISVPNISKGVYTIIAETDNGIIVENFIKE